MEFPKKCPYCGKDIVENVVRETHDGANKIEMHQCVHCGEHIITVAQQKIEGDVCNLGTNSLLPNCHYR